MNDDDVRLLAHRYRHTGIIPTLCQDWLQLSSKVATLEQLVASLAERCAGQSELLTRNAERE